jgi:hypothetical protein
MFRSLSYDTLQVSSFVLSALPLLRLFASSSCIIRCVAVCRPCVCVSGVSDCGLSADNPQTGTPDTHTHRQHTVTHRIMQMTKQTNGDVVTH